MSFSIEFADETQEYQARIKVVGCGGSGGNAVNTMINFGLEGVEFIVVNTDAQALNGNAAPTKLNIGNQVTRGLGAGADPERGRKAALEDHQRIKELISGADMVFVTAGMGGGTGTGAAPVIAQLAREEGALTVGVVTKPFLFEGRQRSRRAELGLAQLAEHVDTLITIPNQKLLMLGEEDLSFVDAFRKADEVLYQAVKGISDLITQNGIVNVDFADVKTVMSNMGRALMGTGIAKGQNRSRLAAEMAISSPLLDDISVDGATGVLINIVGGPDLKMREIQEAASLVQEQAHEDANIIFGASIDESLGETVKVTVIATGFDTAEKMQTMESHGRVMAQVPASMQMNSAGPSTVPSMQSQYQQTYPTTYTSQSPLAQAQHATGSRPVFAAATAERQERIERQERMERAAQAHAMPSSMPAVAPAPSSPRSVAAAAAAAERAERTEREPVPAFSTRRIAQSQQSPTSQRHSVRSERANATFPAFDTDWDIPAFQRKGGSGQ